MEGDSQLDSTNPPSSLGSQTGSQMGSQMGGASRSQFSSTATIGGQTSTFDASAVSTMSSSEIILGEVKKHKRGFALAVGLILIAGVAAAIWWKFFSTPRAAPFRNVKITRLTTGGKIGNAAIKGYTSISPDGKT